MYLGVDYYPEHWDMGMMDEDMRRMREMGANIIRIGEFTWHLMERSEGHFDFSFFDMVINNAKKYQLKVMFGTPTATFPAWLSAKHPSILSKDEYGHTRVFGGRRQYCFSSETYREYSSIIVEKLVSHYRDEEAILAWQIDNEFGHEGSDICYCEQCHDGFRKFLNDKYKDIETLNKVYGTIFWGQTYNSFDEIPMPQPTITTHNPSLRLDWVRFRSHSVNSFAKLQIDLVKKHKGAHQQVTHNFSGGFFDKAYDLNKIAAELDFAAYDNYPVWGGLMEPLTSAHIAMAHDYIRGLKKKNYWVVEELMGAQGHNIIGYLPRPDQAKMWAYQAMAHGCENLLFFRWRGMTRGAEQFCLGIIDQDNETGRKFYEVQSFMEDVRKHERVLQSEIKSEIAVLYDYDNIWSWRCQQQSSEFDFTNELVRLYTPFYSLNATMDVISTSRDFSAYKVLVVPVMQIIDLELSERLKQFAAKGGTVLFSFRSGIKDRDNNIHFGKVFPCNIRDFAGICIKEAESLQTGQEVQILGQGEHRGRSGRCRVWRDIITTESAEVLYNYTDKFYGGNACITINEYIKGKVYYVGGGADDETLKSIAKEILAYCGIRHMDTPEGLEAYTRNYNEEEWLIMCNHTDREIVHGDITYKPFESRIMKR
ncbi:MAG: beta-galactosidase [Clostridia bacterium]